MKTTFANPALLALCLCASVPMCLLPTTTASAGEVQFAAKPAAAKAGDGAKITFAVSAPTDVEVAVLAADGKVVRHLAAGVLGGEKPPPEPLKAGLSQALEWDGKTDLGKAAEGGPFKFRVRAGTGVKFGRLIGATPYNLGNVSAALADEDGNLYVLAGGGQLNQGSMILRVFDKEGLYLREVVPFPATIADGEMKGVAAFDEERGTWQPRQRSNLNPDFYNGTKTPLSLVSVSKEGGVVLKDLRTVGPSARTIVLETSGAVRGFKAPANMPPAKPGDIAVVQKAGKVGKGDLPIDWTRLVVDAERDEVYVNDGCSLFWRFKGETGEGGLLKRDGRPFGATDLAFGYDGLIYARTGRGAADGCDYSGPFERFDRDLKPAPFAGGTHVLSPYIYSRYGIGYAERGIGVGPDGKSYLCFMYKWVAYGIAGFDAEGKPMKGKYLEGVFPGGGKYPPELKSAIIGPVPQGNAGIRVDLKGNIYVGMLYLPKDFIVPKGQDKMVWSFMVGGVGKFGPEGGRVKGDEGMMRGNEAEGLLDFYPGYGPFSSAGFTSNPCCVCRAPRFDLDRYGRVVMPNGVSCSVRLVDNAGNLIVEFGKYGNFDSQYVPPDAKDAKPLIPTPEIPLGWATGAGFGPDRLYVLDSYAKRVVRADLTWKAQETCELK
jgi:hypothetical protein